MADNQPAAPIISASVVAPGVGRDSDHAPFFFQRVAPFAAPDAHAAAARAIQAALTQADVMAEADGLDMGDLFDGKHPLGLPWVCIMRHGGAKPELTALPLRRDADLMRVAELAGVAVNRAMIPFRLDQEWTATRDEEPNNGR